MNNKSKNYFLLILGLFLIFEGTSCNSVMSSPQDNLTEFNDKELLILQKTEFSSPSDVAMKFLRYSSENKIDEADKLTTFNTDSNYRQDNLPVIKASISKDFPSVDGKSINLVDEVITDKKSVVDIEIRDNASHMISVIFSFNLSFVEGKWLINSYEIKKASRTKR